MYNTVLVPVDFANEEQTIQVLKKAGKLSKKKMILLHVLEVIPEFILNELPSNIRLNKESNTRKAMEALAEKAGVKASIEIRNGRSYNNILESAKENKADLIIINSHRPGFQDYLLGSTAAKVVRFAQCAVLVER